MYIVIKQDKSEQLKHKVHELKELACDVLEYLEEAYSEGQEADGRERSRRDSRYEVRMRRDEYDDYDRDTTRSRGSRSRY